MRQRTSNEPHLLADGEPSSATTIPVIYWNNAADRDRRRDTCRSWTTSAPIVHLDCIPIENDSHRRSRCYHISNDHIYPSTDNSSTVIEGRHSRSAGYKWSSSVVSSSTMFQLDETHSSSRWNGYRLELTGVDFTAEGFRRQIFPFRVDQPEWPGGLIRRWAVRCGWRIEWWFSLGMLDGDFSQYWKRVNRSSGWNQRWR